MFNKTVQKIVISMEDFPHGPVVKNPPASEGDMGLMPCPVRFHMPWGNWIQVPELPKPKSPPAHALQQEKPPPRWEAHALWLEKSPCTTTKTQCSHKEISRTKDQKVSVVEKETATHSSVLAWRIPGTGKPGGLPSLGSHRVGLDWSNLAAAAAAGVFIFYLVYKENSPFLFLSLSVYSFFHDCTC